MILVILAALSGALAVVAGAFGAHGATAHAAEILKTGAQYQMLHAVAALVAIRMGATGPAWLFVAGGFLFAGSLYALAIGGPRWLGPITPVGGALMIGGWLWLAWERYAYVNEFVSPAKAGTQSGHPPSRVNIICRRHRFFRQLSEQ